MEDKDDKEKSQVKPEHENGYETNSDYEDISIQLQDAPSFDGLIEIAE